MLNLFVYSCRSAQEKEKKRKSAAARWCFEVCSPYSSIENNKGVKMELSFLTVSFLQTI
jgi:hypothetical protein